MVLRFFRRPQWLSFPVHDEWWIAVRPNASAKTIVNIRKRGLMLHQNWWQLQHSQLMAGGNEILANSIDVDAVPFFWERGKFFRGAGRKMRKTRAECSTKSRCAGLTWSMIGMPWPLSQVSVVPPRVSRLLIVNIFFNVFSSDTMTTYFNVAAGANLNFDLEIDVYIVNNF